MAKSIMTIPTDAFPLMATRRPEQAYQELIDIGRLPSLEILTFGLVNTPISDTPTYDPDRIIAYVSYWEGGHVTVCALDGDLVRLVYAGPGQMITQEQALELFRNHWPIVKSQQMESGQWLNHS